MEFIEKYYRIDGSDDDIEDFNEAGDDDENNSDIDFIDDKENFQNQEPIKYCLMNVTRELQETINDDSMAQELDLMPDKILKILFLIFLMRLSMRNFKVLKKGYKNSCKNLRPFVKGQRILFTK